MGHLALNTIGTLVLGGSNYLQQICTSPTADEVHSSISTNESLHFRTNVSRQFFKRKGLPRKLIWVLLVATSLPIHIILNSVFVFEQEASALYSGKYDVTYNRIPCKQTSIDPEECLHYQNEFRSYAYDFTNIRVVVLLEEIMEEYSDLDVNQNSRDSSFSGFPRASDITSCCVTRTDTICVMSVQSNPLTILACTPFMSAGSKVLGIDRHLSFRWFSTLRPVDVLLFLVNEHHRDHSWWFHWMADHGTRNVAQRIWNRLPSRFYVGNRTYNSAWQQ